MSAEPKEVWFCEDSQLMIDLFLCVWLAGPYKDSLVSNLVWADFSTVRSVDNPFPLPIYLFSLDP